MRRARVVEHTGSTPAGSISRLQAGAIRWTIRAHRVLTARMNLHAKLADGRVLPVGDGRRQRAHAEEKHRGHRPPTLTGLQSPAVFLQASSLLQGFPSGPEDDPASGSTGHPSTESSESELRRAIR